MVFRETICRFFTNMPQLITSNSSFINPKPIIRINETLQNKRKRLVYQTRKRGILECDLLLSNFADKYLDQMNEKELCLFDKLLDENDWDIFLWLTEKKTVPSEHNSELIQKVLRTFL